MDTELSERSDPDPKNYSESTTLQVSIHAKEAQIETGASARLNGFRLHFEGHFEGDSTYLTANLPCTQLIATHYSKVINSFFRKKSYFACNIRYGTCHNAALKIGSPKVGT